MIEIVKDYRENDSLRKSFNELAEKTFGINFENWYQIGYWREKYIPYSAVLDGRVIANVSVNIMDMMYEGKMQHLIQLGTVMTDEAFRNQGLIRRIMEEVEKDYADQADGMYLYANDCVVEFYPKFGFKKSAEYQYTKHVNTKDEATICQIPMTGKEQLEQLEKAMKNSFCQGVFDMAKNLELYMFYITGFMQENVYFAKLPAGGGQNSRDCENTAMLQNSLKVSEGKEELLQDVWVIAEVEEDELLLHAVFAEQKVNLDDVIRSFGKDIKRVVFGFTPVEKDSCECQKIREEDTTFFVKGRFFEKFDEKQLMFPVLSHA